MDLKDKLALVTGAATGIGLEYVRELLKNGVKIVTILDTDKRKGEQAIVQLTKEFGKERAIFKATDVTKPKEFEAAFKEAVASMKGLDILINNAGILDDKRWELEIALNINAVVQGTLMAFQYMGKDMGGKGGVVANIASILGLHPLAGAPVYVATKHAVVGLSRSFGMPFHFNKTGVRVVTMCPGVTDTPLISEANHKQMDGMGEECARELNELPKQKPEHVAKCMMHILTKGSNGSVWVSEGTKPVYQVNIPYREDMKATQ